MEQDAAHLSLAATPDRPASACHTSVAEAYLALLKARGIDFLYLGAGTDTAPLVEAYARHEATAESFPRPIITSHENLAVGMAHGYYMVTGRPQAVMLHVSVGAANAVCGLLNAARSQVPMLFTAGRTPLFEQGPLGSRDGSIHWAQEMFDQAAMVREIVKWDYELRDGINLEQVIDRALTIALTAPRGPVCLTLPREVLARPAAQSRFGAAPPIPTLAFPDPAAVARLAEVLANAEYPVIACTASGADAETVALVAQLCDRFDIGVVEAKSRYLSVPASHPLHLGYDIAPVFQQADAVLFLESDVPWVPVNTEPRNTAFIAHAGTDPLFARYPLRSFRSDLSITASVRALLSALSAALEQRRGAKVALSRRARLSAAAQAVRSGAQAVAANDEARGGPISKVFLSRCLDRLRPRDAIVVNEYSARREQMHFETPGSYFGIPPSAGLGWGLPAALGAQQAAPDRTVIAVLGDGAYLFANPASCHHAAALHRLPVLTVVFNNQRWDAVSSSTASMYPESYTARAIARDGFGPLSALDPVPDFERYSEASGGHGERVTEREQLLPALERALKVVTQEKRQALVNVIGA
ncbi:benzoylformate decarboxylase [mine drainage metagenome]|uniref:Benzoylformate decarboxylase n=1 Tax=mine drainage metagenome TaxID=410659 RepID=A0A1J5RD19_9ZZZZ